MAAAARGGLPALTGLRTGFAALLEATARRHPGRPALRWEGGTCTHGELAERAGAFARTLRVRGLRPGDRVAISMTNRPELVVAIVGGLAAGATVAPVDPLLRADERRDVLEDLAPRWLVDEHGVTAGAALAAQPPARARDGLPPALVVYTSGSTGRPKGAVLSHAALTFANRSWAGPVIGVTEGDVLLGALPLTHAFGLNGALLAPLLAGACVVLVERFVPEAVGRLLETAGVSVLPAVATMFRRLLDLPGFRGAPPLRLAVSGAAPCPWELAEEWRRRTGTRIIRGYGSTELFRPISYLAADPTDLPGCTGRPVPNVEVRIVDDAGHALGPDEEGELWIRTPAVMDGYLGAPEETEAVLGDGWFRTGDLARLTPDGHVSIVGRKRERILRGGYSIFPVEVETVLLAHPAVAEAAVVGVPHPDLGEEVAAFVALRAGGSIADDELIAWCRERLAGFKYPRRVTVLPALPRSATGKVLKSRLVAPSPDLA